MKKYFSNIFALAALLMAGAAFTACSSDDNTIEQPANPVGEKTYTLTINASKGDNASTRALALDEGKLVASWEDGDLLTIYNTTKGAALTGSLTASNANGATATFSGTLTGTIDPDDQLFLIYHQPTGGMSDYAAQTGTLASAAARDYAVAQVTVASVESGNITIKESSASFSTQTAMLKLTLEDDDKNKLNPTQLKLSAAMSFSVGSITMPLTEELVTLDLSGDPYSDNGAGILYFVLPNKTAVAEALLKPENVAGLLPTATLTYTATVGEDTYTATKTGYTFAAGKYYAGTLKMNKYPIALSAVTSDYIGSVITTDGNVYATVADATAASKTALAMIAYVGSSTGVDGKTHGLALALSNEDGTKNWTIATGAGGAAAHTPAAPTSITSSWMLPSKDQWTSMINAAGGYVVLRNGFSSIGGDNLNNGSYWSSTGDDSNSSKAWGINFNSGDWLSSAKTNYRNVRASLAF